MRKEYLFRMARLIGGTSLSALGIVVMLQANIGLEPWSIFHQGLEYTIGISFGGASIVTGATAIGLAVLMGESFGVGTLFNIVLCGVVIDAICALNLLPQAASLPAGLLFLLVGMELLAFGTWLYMSSGLGAGPRDSLTVALVRKTGRSVGVCRTCMEVLVTLSGWLMGGKLGVGTLLTAAAFGGLLDLNFHLLRFDPAKQHQENLLETLHRLGYRAQKEQPPR